MTTRFDTCRRANNATLGVFSDGSLTWEEHVGSLSINTNRIIAAADGQNLCRAGDLATDDHTVFCDVTDLTSAAGNTVGLLARINGSNREGYLFLIRRDASNYRLFKTDSVGTLTQVGSTVTEALPSLPFTAEFEIIGTTLVGRINGVQKVTTTDSTYTTGKKAGIYTNRTAGATVGVRYFQMGDVSTTVNTATPFVIGGEGNWTWFTHPFAVYDSSNGKTIAGWVNSNGDVGVSSFDQDTGRIGTFTMTYALEYDDHDNAAPWIRLSDGKYQNFYCKHSDTTGNFYRVSTNAGDLLGFAAVQTITLPAGEDFVSYNNPCYLSSNSALYFIHRTNDGSAGKDQKWGYRKTTDFASFGSVVQFFSNANPTRPYLIPKVNGTDRIDFFCSNETPPLGASSIYHFYMKLDAGVEKFYKTDGTLISASLPIQPGDLTLVANATGGRKWTQDITIDDSGQPRLLALVYPNNDGTNIDYWVYKYSGGSWSGVLVLDQGGSLLNDFYPGGGCFDGNDCNRLWLSSSHETPGGPWNVYIYDSGDDGATWTETTQVTTDTDATIVNGRPWSPEGHTDGSSGVAAVWWRGTYPGFTTYVTQVMGVGVAARDSGPTVPDAPTIGTATPVNPTTIQVSYTAPGNNGGATITSYTATSSPGGFTGTLSQAGSGTITVSAAFVPSQAYTFTVYATNSVGNSAASSASAATATSPGAPTIGTATVLGPGRARISYTAPASNGGSTITGYTVTATPGGYTGTNQISGSGSVDIEIQPGGTFTFKVKAENVRGFGSESGASNSITLEPLGGGSSAPGRRRKKSQSTVIRYSDFESREAYEKALLAAMPAPPELADEDEDDDDEIIKTIIMKVLH